MIEQLKGRRGSSQGHDLSMISRCYECLRAQQWTQRGVRTKAMTRRLFVPGKWLPARSYDRATNPLFELSPLLSPHIHSIYLSSVIQMQKFLETFLPEI